MAMDGIRVGSFGIEFLLTVTEDGVAQDISSYSTLQMVFVKPDGSEVEKTAAAKTDGTDGQITYVAEDGLIDTAGAWSVYANVLKSGHRHPGGKVDFWVKA